MSIFLDDDLLKVVEDLNTAFNVKNECAVCKKVFNSTSDLNYHENVHKESKTEFKPFSCSKCDESFVKKGNWKIHYNSVHKNANNLDSIIKTEFSVNKKATRTVLPEITPKNFENKLILAEEAVDDPLPTLTQDMVNKNETYSSDIFIKTETSVNRTLYTEDSFIKPEASVFMKAYSSDRYIKTEYPVHEKPYNEDSIIKTKSSAHKKVYNGENNIKSESSVHKDTYNADINIKSDELYICSELECVKLFDTKGELENHQKVHQNDENLKLSKNARKITEKMVHKNDKVEVKEADDKNANYNRNRYKDNFENNVIQEAKQKSKKNQESNVCKQCEYIALNKDILKEHLRINHIGTCYACLFCDYDFKDIDELYAHMKNMHRTESTFLKHNVRVPFLTVNFTPRGESNKAGQNTVKVEEKLGTIKNKSEIPFTKTSLIKNKTFQKIARGAKEEVASTNHTNREDINNESLTSVEMNMKDMVEAIVNPDKIINNSKAEDSSVDDPLQILTPTKQIPVKKGFKKIVRGPKVASKSKNSSQHKTIESETLDKTNVINKNNETSVPIKNGFKKIVQGPKVASKSSKSSKHKNIESKTPDKTNVVSKNNETSVLDKKGFKKIVRGPKVSSKPVDRDSPLWKLNIIKQNVVTDVQDNTTDTIAQGNDAIVSEANSSTIKTNQIGTYYACLFCDYDFKKKEELDAHVRNKHRKESIAQENDITVSEVNNGTIVEENPIIIPEDDPISVESDTGKVSVIPENSTIEIKSDGNIWSNNKKSNLKSNIFEKVEPTVTRNEMINIFKNKDIIESEPILIEESVDDDPLPISSPTKPEEISQTDNDDDDDFECNDCLETFWYKSQLNDHFRNIHGVNNRAEYEKQKQETAALKDQKDKKGEKKANKSKHISDQKNAKKSKHLLTSPEKQVIKPISTEEEVNKVKYTFEPTEFGGLSIIPISRTMKPIPKESKGLSIVPVDQKVTEISKEREIDNQEKNPSPTEIETNINIDNHKGSNQSGTKSKPQHEESKTISLKSSRKRSLDKNENMDLPRRKSARLVNDQMKKSEVPSMVPPPFLELI